jgi:hypothetical protein
VSDYTEPTDDEREALARIMHADDVKHRRAHDDYDFWLANEELSGCYYDNAAAVLAAGFRRQGPVTDAQVEAAALAYAGDDMSPEEWEWVKTRPEVVQPFLDGMRAALEAARDAS